MARRLAKFYNRDFLAGHEEDPRDFPFPAGWREHDRAEPEPQRVILPTSGVATNGKTILDWDQAALQLTRESPGWGLTLGAGATVTYAFRATAPPAMPSDTAGFSQFSAAQIAATEAVLALWSDVANITFVRVAPGGYSNAATILFANYSSGVAGAAAFAFLPTPPVSTLPGSFDGDVWVNITLPDNQDLTPGGFGMHVLAHEIGHAIGLSHPGDYNGAGADYALDAVYWQDSRAFTVMSYFGSPNVGATLPEFSPGPQFHDIAAVQRLYGPNLSTRTGDTIYGFNSNTGREHYTLTSATVGATFTIWDGGGVDTLDLSGYGESADIDLRPGAHSSAGPTDTTPAAYNIAIALGVIIENAVGGVSRDTLTGNGANNVLTGNDGDDSLFGNGGADALLGGNGADLLDGGAGADAMTGAAGDDRYRVDETGDVVTELFNAGADTVESSAPSFTLPENVESLKLIGNGLSGAGNGLDNAIFGNELGNLLSGGDGADVIEGGAGNDTIDGGAGDDYVTAFRHVDFGAESNIYTGGAGFDTIEFISNQGVSINLATGVVTGGGVAGADTIGGFERVIGTSYPDVLVGDEGDNILAGGDSGGNTIDGGGGTDTIDYSSTSFSGALTINLLTSVGGLATGLDTFSGIENVFGTQNSDAITGDNGTNFLRGFHGFDEIHGNGGDDVLSGDTQADTLDGGDGVDTASYATALTGVTVRLLMPALNTGDAEGDSFVSIERLSGSHFNDVLEGDDNINVLAGDAGDDALDGGVGGDTLIGGAGADSLDGGAGADTLIGGAGNDTYFVDTDVDIVTELIGEGTDSVNASATYFLFDNVENLTLTGVAAINGSGNALANVITGNGAVNQLFGNAGNDTLDGGAGADSLFGGLGDDLYIVDNAGDFAFEGNVAWGVDLVQASVSYALGQNIDNLTLVGAALVGNGNLLANVIVGNANANTLFGMAGNDTLNGGAGADQMFGGLGDDLYIVDNGGDFTFEAQSAWGTDTVQTNADYQLGQNIDNLVLQAGAGALTGRGNLLNNTLTGNESANTLFGFAGNDTLDGGGGADQLYGREGDDAYIVDNVGDVVAEVNAAWGTDTIFASVTYFLSPNIEHLTLTGAANINGNGNSLNNTLTGNSGANTLSGQLGNDVLDGGAGADALFGGEGDDTYIVDNAGDVGFEASAAWGIDLVQASVSHTLGTNLDNLTLTGAAAINATGNNLANVINGNSGANQLFGLGGADTLNGGAGNDSLDGGAGDDAFVFAPGSGSDTVAGFIAGGAEDSINLSAYNGTGVTWTITQSGADTVFAFSNGDQITLANVTAANLVQTDPFGYA